MSRLVPAFLQGLQDLVPVPPGDVVDAALGALGGAVRGRPSRPACLGHVYDLRSSGGGTVAPRYSTGIPPSG